MKNPDCTTCLWEYMCDWDRSDCRYTPEKEVDYKHEQDKD